MSVSPFHSRAWLALVTSAAFTVAGTTRADAAPIAAASPAPVATAAAVANDPCSSLSNLVSRPTFGTATCTVKPAQLLIESGYTNAITSGSNAGSLVTYPQASLRVGIGHDLEFDFAPASLARISGNPRVDGITDSALGLKYEFGYTSKAIFGANLLYTLPTGDGPFTGNGDGFLFNLNANYALSPALGLYASLGYNAQSAGTIGVPARYHDFQPSLGASLSLPQGFAVFLEAFDQSSTGPGVGGRFGYDAGFQKDLGSRLQLDVNYFDYGAQFGSHQRAIGFGAAYLLGS